MAVAAQIHAQGQLPSSKGTLWTVPGGEQSMAAMVALFNAGSNTEVAVIYLKKSGGTSRVVGRAVLEPNAGADLMIDRRGGLGAGDLVEGQSTNASAVDYTISGGERS